MLGLRKENRNLLQQLKQIYVQVSISGAKCRALRLQAVEVMTLGVSLESRSRLQQLWSSETIVLVGVGSFVLITKVSLKS